MRRRPSTSIVANPVLVGAVCVLVVTVAVFLAYNANRGLPFVPTTQLKFEVASGGNLLPGNDVKEGGSRIGVVDDMRPRLLSNGRVGALVSVKLDQDAGDIPADSTIAIRPRSLVGLKYVELTRGRSRTTLADGDTIRVEQARVPNELDDLQSMYDERTRDGVRKVLRGAGDALAMRGASLNETIADAPRLLRRLEPVARNLADPGTQLGRFLRELGDAARVVAPVAERYAHGFEAGAITFAAWSRYEERLRETVRQARPTLDAGVESLRVQRPFLRDLRDFAASLRDASAVMPRTLPNITVALREGTDIQRRSLRLNRDLTTTLTRLRELMSDPATGYAFRALTETTGLLKPLIRFVGPYVTVCNYFNYAFTHLGEHVTEPDPTGTSQRTLLNQAPRTRNPTDPQLGSLGARRPVNGEPVVSGEPANLHLSLYGAAIDEQGNADCEGGQRGYLEKLTAYSNDPKLKIVTDPHIPGNQGTTFTGRTRVPAGQTFTRFPESGRPFPKELAAP